MRVARCSVGRPGGGSTPADGARRTTLLRGKVSHNCNHFSDNSLLSYVTRWRPLFTQRGIVHHPQPIVVRVSVCTTLFNAMSNNTNQETSLAFMHVQAG